MSVNNTNKTTAGLIALILGLLGFGWLGIHKFVMGYNKQGVIYLLISALTCGIGAAVMTIISIVEGVVYLTKSDADFHRDYVIGRKEWF